MPSLTIPIRIYKQKLVGEIIGMVFHANILDDKASSSFNYKAIWRSSFLKWTEKKFHGFFQILNSHLGDETVNQLKYDNMNSFWHVLIEEDPNVQTRSRKSYNSQI